MLSFVKTYKYIIQNDKKALRRHPLVEQNKFMKFFLYLFLGFWVIYLMFLGFALSQVDSMSREMFDNLDGYMILFLALDFVVRLSFQEVPSQRIKPYLVSPMKRSHMIDAFLIKLILSSYNLFWLFFWVPFSAFTILHFYGIGGFLFYNLCWVLLYVINGFWFLFWRTVARTNAFYYLIPLAIYGGLAYWGVLTSENGQWLFFQCMCMGRFWCENHIAATLILLLVLLLFYVINRKHQIISIYKEISLTESTNISTSQMVWLNRFGIIGEYLKLEIKSTKRNKVVRKSFLVGLVAVLVFCMLFAFTDLYDTSLFMETFICMYCFACLGTITLTSVMSPEGNYMDFLLSRKESIYYLLKAKYYYNCVLLLIPFFFSLFPVFKEKFTLLEILGAMFFVSGCVFPFLFQQAVYNSNTIPLNEQIIRQNNNSKIQFVVSLVALFVPMILMTVLMSVFEKQTASFILLAIGLAGTTLHSIWIKNIYKRFMKRRYINMEGFRNTKKY